MLMVAALPDWLAGSIPQPIDAARREGLEGTHDLRQTVMGRAVRLAGGFQTRPYGICISEQHNSMHVVGPHDELVQRNMGVVPGQILPGGEHRGRVVGALEHQRTLAGAIRDADRDKVGGQPGVVVYGEPDGPRARIPGGGVHHGLLAGGFETRPYDDDTRTSAGNCSEPLRMSGYRFRS